MHVTSLALVPILCLGAARGYTAPPPVQTAQVDRPAAALAMRSPSPARPSALVRIRSPTRGTASRCAPSWARAGGIACALRAGGSSPRVPPPTCAMPAEVDGLKEELLELVDEEVEEGTRGVGARAEVADDILEIVTELDADGRGAVDWQLNPDIGGTWRLIYTSSKTFANNEGLSGYARDLRGVSTPELLMKVETTFRRITFEEPLQLEDGSIAALVGRFADAKSVQVECVWNPTSAGVMNIQSRTVVVGENSWEPADRQDKAVRALGAGRPIYLDDEILVMRSEPAYVCWVFERA